MLIKEKLLKKRRKTMKNNEKELFLEMIRVEEDLEGMNSELYNLIEKYPNNMELIELEKQNRIFYNSDVLRKISETYLNNLREKISATEFENILEKYKKSLEEIKSWLNNTAKKYLEKNFEQKDLKVYWFEPLPKFH